MKSCLICAVSVLALLTSTMLADVVSVQPADSYSTVRGSAGWQAPQKTYTVSNASADYIYWHSSSSDGKALCQPQGGWIAPGAAKNISISPAGSMASAAPGTYSDQIILDFDPRVLGDTNGDGAVNVGDLQKIVLGWGNTVGGPLYDLPSDLNNDGQINTGDLQLLVQHWGQTYTMTSI